jgi:hypothetical protein
MRKAILAVLACLSLVALPQCGSDDRPAGDAMVDAPVSLDCTTYCDAIQANCTGVNAQYPDSAHCRAACSSFVATGSTVDDVSGNTLGCRIFYAGNPAKMAPSTNCALAGPAGDRITASVPAFCSGGDVCMSFCVLEVQACGSVDVPLPGDPHDASRNSIYQYRNVPNCMRQCASLDKAHDYAIASTGDSLSCRLLQATSAAIAVDPNAIASCASTAAAPTGMCAGAAAP